MSNSEILEALNYLRTHLESQFTATNSTIKACMQLVDSKFTDLLSTSPSPAPASSPAFRSGGSSSAPQQRRLPTAPVQRRGSSNSGIHLLSFDVTSAAASTSLAAATTSAAASTSFSAAPPPFHSPTIDKGLTIFAPNDETFKDADAPDLSKLSNAEMVSLLQNHALATHVPVGSQKQTKGRITTLATNGAGKYDLDTGADSSRIASTVLDSTPLFIFSVDGLLLPVELFGNDPSPAPLPPSPKVTPTPNFHFQPLPPPPPLLFTLTKVFSRSTQVDQQLEIKFWPNPLDTEAQAMVIFLGTKDMLGHWWKYVLLGIFRRGVIFSLYALEEVYKDILESPP